MQHLIIKIVIYLKDTNFVKVIEMSLTVYIFYKQTKDIKNIKIVSLI